MCEFVENLVEINNYARIETFVNEKEKHVDNSEKFVVVSELNYKQLFESIILYVNTVLSKINFNFFICNFTLVINFKILSDKKIILNV